MTGIVMPNSYFLLRYTSKTIASFLHFDMRLTIDKPRSLNVMRLSAYVGSFDHPKWHLVEQRGVPA